MKATYQYEGSDQTAQLARLRQFMIWLTPIIFVFAVFYGGTALLFGDLPTGVNGGVIGCYGLLLLIAWVYLRREQVQTTIALIGRGLLGAALILALFQPPLYPNLAVVPLLVVVVVLPYIQGMPLRRQVIGCWFVSVIIAVAGETVPYQTQLPSWLLSMLRVSSLSATMAFVLLLLWQFSSRLQEALAQSQVTNVALQRAQVNLHAQVEEIRRLQQQEGENRQRLERAVSVYLEFVQKVADGDLNQRLVASSNDLLGQLGRGLNGMVESLQRTAQAEQQATTEAKRLQRAEAEDRQRLELAVAEYLEFVQRVAKGDLTQRLAVHYHGALGQLGEGLNAMAENLHHMTEQVLQASSNIASASAEILSATTQQAASAAEQSAAITQTSTTIEEVKSIAQQTAHQAGRVAEESQSMLQVARQGAEAIEETLAGMSQIRTRVESIAHTILNLSEHAQAISAIVTLVSELADQSNLLALNAAIEAARAGEYGRSFAVVAQQVRELAERSKGATNQVREILGQIQHTTNQAVMVTEEGTKGVEIGGKLAGQAGRVIHRIATEVEHGAQENMQIAAAAQQQTVGMEQIGQAMIAIRQATTQALSSTRQAEQSARDLHTLAQSLQQSIAVYRL